MVTKVKKRFTSLKAANAFMQENMRVENNEILDLGIRFYAAGRGEFVRIIIDGIHYPVEKGGSGDSENR